MRVFNYKEFYSAFEKGFIKKNKTSISAVLFKPLFEPAELLDEGGTPYKVGNTNASKWTRGIAIPETIRNAITDDLYKDDILLHFQRDAMKDMDALLKQDMIDALIALVKDSNLEASRKNYLVGLYDKSEYSDFVAYSFMSAIIGSSKNADKQEAELPLDDKADIALDDFRRIVQQMHKQKPSPIPVPEEVDTEEMKYVAALYEAYGETEGKKITGPQDLGKYKKHFDRQRKNYYLAETIHRELRDTIHRDEQGFEDLKDEIEEGIAEKSEADYDTPVKKVDAVMEHAGSLPISRNMEDIMLGWVGPAEKKGVCHMLVNDERLSWVDENEHENE